MRKPIITLLCLVLGLFSFAQAPKAPDFTVTDVDGKTHHLYKDYLDQDKAVMLKLFFVDCPPCNRAAPKVQALYVNEWQGGKGRVEFMELGVKAWDTDDDVRGYVKKHSLTFPAVSPQGGSLVAVSPYTRGDYGRFTGTPTYVVIGPKGDVHFNILFNQLSDTIRSVLVKKPPVDQCPAAFTTRVKLLGKFFYGVSVEDVSIRLQSSDPDLDSYAVPFKDSLYAYECEYELPIDTTTYFLDASYPIPTEAIKGVNTKDLLLVLWHLIGRKVFKDQDLLYAADVNENGLINIQDILFMRQIILEKRTSFPQDAAVRFLDASHEIILDTLLDTLPIIRNQIPLKDAIGRDDILFKAVKLGDITGVLEGLKGSNSSTRTVQQAMLSAQDIFMKKGVTYHIPIYSDNPLRIYALQMGFQLHSGMGEIKSIYSSREELKNMDIYRKESDDVRLLGLSPEKPFVVSPPTPLFYIEIKAKEDQWLSEVLSIDAKMEAILINEEVEEMPIQLRFSTGKKQLEHAAISYKNYSHQIDLNIEEGIHSVTVYDVMGHEVFHTNPAGQVAMKINLPTLSAGIYLVRVRSHNGNALMKRIFVQ